MFIGDARQMLFISGTHRWNGWVRDATAWLEVHCPWLIQSRRKEDL